MTPSSHYGLRAGELHGLFRGAESRAGGSPRRVEQRVRLFETHLFGVVTGYAMTICMSLDWPLLVGGKPIATVPPYVVFMFELMVLIGALSTVTGLVLLSLTKRTTGLAYDPSFSDDRIGIFVPAGGETGAEIERIVRDAGAVEVRNAA